MANRLAPWLLAALAVSGCATTERMVYVSTSFHEPANEGLRFIYSEDGCHWTAIPGTWLTPEVGTQKVMRDPSIVLGPDGTYHLVWTSSWRDDYGFGYSSSRDLIHWTAQRHIVVMEDYDRRTGNVWAPEVFYDDDTREFSIAWSSAIPGRFDGSHRQYYTTTRDFVTFSPARLFYDPGYNSIDGAVLKRGKGDYVLAVKDNRKPGYSHIHVAFGPTAVGPWGNESEPFTPEWAEGPTWAKVGDAYLIYYDLYRQFKYGAVRTQDFVTFTDITDTIRVPEKHKHGTIFMAPERVVNRLIRAGGSGLRTVRL
ncbi:MAG: glycoside hydrolase family 43 protein [Phycisphaerae bacterium]|nr:glycoside hydrolase family 43 protein [Phycisphaerae bacterium]